MSNGIFDRASLQMAQEIARLRQQGNPCPTCDGTGVIVSYDSVPYGMGNTLMESDEYCTACLMRDDARGGSVCNQCGKPRTWDEDGEYFTPCAECGATDPYKEAVQ